VTLDVLFNITLGNLLQIKDMPSMDTSAEEFTKIVTGEGDLVASEVHCTQETV
jgi:hypothetical protein